MGNISSKYLKLIRAFPPRPIRSEAELDRAEAMLRQLLDASSLSAPEQDYLEILGNLIDEYESKAHPIEPLRPNQMLAMSIETKGVTQTEVSRATGIPVSTISELIAQKREFNRRHVEKLCGYFRLDPKAFVHVGVDPFTYKESLFSLGGMPCLFRDFLIKAVLLETTPWTPGYVGAVATPLP